MVGAILLCWGRGWGHIGMADKYLHGRTYSAEDLRGQALKLLQLRTFTLFLRCESLP